MNKVSKAKKHPTLDNYVLVGELDFIELYENTEKDIHIVTFKESTTINAEMAKEALDMVINYKQGIPTFGITDASARFLDFRPDARDYFRKHMHAEHTPLHAIVVGDVATRVLANLFARFERPKIPSRVFNHLNDAIQWIEDAK
jgi:hypothetical protein